MTVAAAATREVFETLAHWEIVLWYSLSGLSVMVFGAGVALLISKYRRGRRSGASARSRGPGRALEVVLSHAWIGRRDGVAGFGHALIFYGFLVLLAGTTVLAVEDDVLKPAFGVEFLRDDFYLGYSLFLDVFGAGLLLGLVVMGLKRAARPARLDYARVGNGRGAFDRRRYVIGDWVFLGSLVFLAATGFLLESFRIAALNPSFETWSPFGWLLGQAFRQLGLVDGLALDAHHVQWWAHSAVALVFVASIPFTKALHMLAAPANVVVGAEEGGKSLAPLDEASEVGYERLVDLSWQHLLSLDACTKCGKCHVACPATASGYPLSPRDLILDLRELAEGAIGIRAALSIAPVHETDAPLMGGGIAAEAVWSCTQCAACVEICPVGIEHVRIINQLRRRLVDRGEVDAGLQSTLAIVAETGNSFGETRRKRPTWAKELGFPVKDIRKEPAEYLWFVGDYAAFHPRGRKATQALAQVLRECGVDFGLLWEAEQTGGCDVRRAGEEGLWLFLAEQNVNIISNCEFGRILSSDPHTFHTLRNDYPAVGGEWPVLHHSQLLLELLECGQLRPRSLGYRVTYHDPCTLGRYNGVYEAPRRVLSALGCELLEMPRNRDNSFCCGAGGGRIWMLEPLPAEGSRRPAEQRLDEASALGSLDHFIVACPKDLTMYDDALKTSGHEGRFQVRELAELVLEALLPPTTVARGDSPGR